ncbi:thiamine diphosphokinase [Alteribacter natronophilus]|uniref:thiamine diphosphokinase n=1 Tax=Alteribacter natronophilus TaxID=2583810 RepID=UPI00110E71FC|nr:thiamine diphosphokinase [Alteribacter natronophilus]TMW73173.1 thiamine diphosphokinase [Alteribacter natronophilus]
MDIVIVAGGPEDYLPSFTGLKKKHRGAVWAGVDRGTFHLLKAGITPSYAFGDFDSVSPEEREWINRTAAELAVYPGEKDETDLELALNALASAEGDGDIWIYGATGGRLDHLLANVQLMLKGLEVKRNLILADRQNCVRLLEPGSYTVTTEMPYVSLIPFTREVKGITLTGFKYNVADMGLSAGESRGVSNELLETRGFLSFREGLLLLLETGDG